jgi:DNA-binding GntR family transcriptional regulator
MPLNSLPKTENGPGRGTASSRIRAALREQIVGMRLLPGAAVVENEIATSFGVSRTPVREALLQLVEERLIEVYPQSGTFVSKIRIDAARDGMIIRDALECVTVAAAINNATPSDMAHLRRVVTYQREAYRSKNFSDFHAADEAFHQAICLIAGHPNIWCVIKREKVEADRCRMLALPISKRLKQVIEEHSAIIEAIASRNVGAAQATMSEHLAGIYPAIDELLQKYPSYFAPYTSRTPFPEKARASNKQRLAFEY